MDLGLPSGTKWATQNVGARKPSDFGLYFQWGDTQGYTAEQVGEGEGQKEFDYHWKDYKWYERGSDFDGTIEFKKYNSTDATLDLEDDAAHANMGGSWHMPSPTQIQELLDNTTTTWTTQDGVNGRLFTSKKDGTKSIFIPAAGYADDGLIQRSGDFGCVWSSMVSYRKYSSKSLFIRDGDSKININSNRNTGYSIRGVINA